MKTTTLNAGSLARLVRPDGCDKTECQGDHVCGQRCPGSTMECTLPIGHDGDHIACGEHPRHNLRRWPNAPASATAGKDAGNERGDAKPPLAAQAGSALWAVMRAHGFGSITVYGVPLSCPSEGPQRFIPVFNTREQAVAWAGSDEHVEMLSPNAKD